MIQREFRCSFSGTDTTVATLWKVGQKNINNRNYPVDSIALGECRTYIKHWITISKWLIVTRLTAL